MNIAINRMEVPQDLFIPPLLVVVVQRALEDLMAVIVNFLLHLVGFLAEEVLRDGNLNGKPCRCRVCCTLCYGVRVCSPGLLERRLDLAVPVELHVCLPRQHHAPGSHLDDLATSRAGARDGVGVSMGAGVIGEPGRDALKEGRELLDELLRNQSIPRLQGLAIELSPCILRDASEEPHALV